MCPRDDIAVLVNSRVCGTLSAGERGPEGAGGEALAGSRLVTIPVEQKVAGHAKNAARHRVLIQFIRDNTPFGAEPDFAQIGRRAKAAGLYSMKTNSHDAAIWLSRAWLQKDYWERLASKQARCGVKLPANFS